MGEFHTRGKRNDRDETGKVRTNSVASYGSQVFTRTPCVAVAMLLYSSPSHPNLSYLAGVYSLQLCSV